MPKPYLADWRAKRVLPVVILALMLLVLFSVFRGEKTSSVKSAQESLDQAQAKIQMGENLLIIRKMEEAKVLFQDSLDIIVPLTKADSPIRDKAQALENRVNNDLNSIPQNQQ